MGIVYSAFCSKSGKMYIGQTVKTLNARKNEHIGNALNGSKKCRAFYDALRKYGHENFSWKVLIEILSGQNDLNNAEKYWIEELETLVPNGYNLIEGGGSTGKRSAETLERITSANRRADVNLRRSQTMKITCAKQEVKERRSLAQKKVNSDPIKKAKRYFSQSLEEVNLKRSNSLKESWKKRKGIL